MNCDLRKYLSNDSIGVNNRTGMNKAWIRCIWSLKRVSLRNI